MALSLGTGFINSRRPGARGDGSVDKRRAAASRWT